MKELNAERCLQILREVKDGIPYKIQQEHCLHCGLCFENCPVSAIIKRSKQK